LYFCSSGKEKSKRGEKGTSSSPGPREDGGKKKEGGEVLSDANLSLLEREGKKGITFTLFSGGGIVTGLP